jgi:DnaJ family protein B protein 4
MDHNPPKTESLPVTLTLSLEDVFHGNNRLVSWVRRHTTTVGQTTETPVSFEIAVPKGIRHGDKMTLKGKGNTAEGRSQGDVVVTVEIAPHATFRREGNDLVVVADITLAQALSGVTVSVQSIEGRVIPLLIDEIVHPRFRRNIAGEGLPCFGNPSERGNLIVECSTKFPTYLTAEQKSEIRRILEH